MSVNSSTTLPMTHSVILALTKAMSPCGAPTTGWTWTVTSKMHMYLHAPNAKSHMSKPTSPLHSLPVPDDHFDTVALDFIRPLPEEHGKDTILTRANIHITATHSTYTAAQVAVVLFNKWYCENGLMLHSPPIRTHSSPPTFGLLSISLLASNWRCQPPITLKQMAVANRQTKQSTRQNTKKWKGKHSWWRWRHCLLKLGVYVS